MLTDNELAPGPEGGGDRLGPKPRGYARLISSLAKHAAWTDKLSDRMRSSILRRLRDSLERAVTSREIASVVRAIASLEQNDIARARLLLEAEHAPTQEQDQALRLKQDLDAIYALEGLQRKDAN